MRVGFHSPLPPARTGVAGYASALLPALRRRGIAGVNAARADVHLYHIGNNQRHLGIYARALERPGVVVLHDAVLQHLFLGSLDKDAYVEEFVHNYGEWRRELAGELWRGRARSASDPRYFGYPMLRRIAEASRAVVVHNPAAARMVAAHAPSARVVEIPHLFSRPVLPAASEVSRMRQQLGLGNGAFVFGVFGYMRESKRLATVLRAFEEVRRGGGGTALLLAGEFVSSDLLRALSPMLKQPGVLRLGHTADRLFSRLLLAADACVNLRYPSAGETSGITVQCMGTGKPVLLTAGEENSRFPETACVRVEPGIGETAALTESMMWLAQFPDAAREIGRRAAAHVEEHHSLDVVADAYRRVLEACRD